MDRYYVIINGVEYFFSGSMLLGNDMIKNYLVDCNGRQYLFIDKMILDNQFDSLLAFYNASNLWTGMMVQDTDSSQKFSSMGYAFRNIDHLIKHNKKNGRIDECYKLMLDGIIGTLEFYDSFMRSEEEYGDNKKRN